VLEDCFHSKAESITSATNEKGGLGARRFEKILEAGCPGGALLHPGVKTTSSSWLWTSSPSSPSLLS
jgi:hypothetical protein